MHMYKPDTLAPQHSNLHSDTCNSCTMGSRVYVWVQYPYTLETHSTADLYHNETYCHMQ